MKKVIIVLIKIVFYFITMIFTAFCFGVIVCKNKDKTTLKYKTYYKMMLAWMEVLENDWSLERFFKERGFDRIAIYGGKDAGGHLIRQLRNTSIEDKYIIDRSMFSGSLNMLPIYRPDEMLPEIDAVIVTPVWDFDQIKEQLVNRVKCPIISLEEVITGRDGHA